MIIKNVIYHFIFTIVLKDVRDGIVHFIMFITSKQKIYQYNDAKQNMPSLIRQELKSFAHLQRHLGILADWSLYLYC
jgi:hypothetical protein